MITFSRDVDATDHQNDAIVPVPAMCIDDEPLTIIIRQCGVSADGAARFAYEVIWQNVTRVSGDDLFGPASGVWPEARDMAVTLAGFLGATFECGALTEHGESYSQAEQAWLETHAERLSCWAADVHGEES